jgi:hypothetical protein
MTEPGCPSPAEGSRRALILTTGGNTIAAMIDTVRAITLRRVNIVLLFSV